MNPDFWMETMTDDFYKLFDSKYNSVYRGCYDTWQGVDQIMTHATICGPKNYFDRLLFEYRLYRHMAASMRKGTFDMHRDVFIIITAAAFYVLEVKGMDRYIEPVLTVLDNLMDDCFFMYSRREFNDYVFIAAQIAGPQATAYALDKLDICQPISSDDMTL